MVMVMVYDAIIVGKATLILDTKTVLQDGRILQRKIWQLSQPEPGRPFGWKYSLYCGIGGRTIVRYDNETGKGDHRHVGAQERESAYVLPPLRNFWRISRAKWNGSPEKSNEAY
jgi:Family of unknown function (DUF6516)